MIGLYFCLVSGAAGVGVPPVYLSNLYSHLEEQAATAPLTRFRQTGSFTPRRQQIQDFSLRGTLKL